MRKTATASPHPDGSLFSSNEIAQAQAPTQGPTSGRVTNDVGNTVIVPKPGESFADTMKRAAAQGGTVTQDQINREMATAPRKVATTLAAAPAIGAGGAAALAAPGEIAGAGERLLQLSESQLGKFAEAYPHIVKLASALGTPLTIGGMYELFQHAMSKGK
jgi:hypothetical protein